MTNIHLVSDLHFEFIPDAKYQAPPGTDVICIPGDLFVGPMAIDIAARIGDQNNAEVVFLSGNHEHYNGDGITVNQYEMQKAATYYDHVHFLNRSSVYIQGVRFVGATLWTDFDLDGTADRMIPGYSNILNDARYSGTSGIEILDRHVRDLEFIKREGKKLGDEPLVIMTHHGVSRKSISPAFATSPYNCFWASNLDDVVADSGADYWFHGHVHHSRWFQLGRTVVACNPMGYHHNGKSEDTGWSKEFLVEL